MVGPTYVQAGQVCLVDQFLLVVVCRCFFRGKSGLSVPLASWGSLVRNGVSMKLDVEKIKIK